MMAANSRLMLIDPKSKRSHPLRDESATPSRYHPAWPASMGQPTQSTGSDERHDRLPR